MAPCQKVGGREASVRPFGRHSLLTQGEEHHKTIEGSKREEEKRRRANTACIHQAKELTCCSSAKLQAAHLSSLPFFFLQCL